MLYTTPHPSNSAVFQSSVKKNQSQTKWYEKWLLYYSSGICF